MIKYKLGTVQTIFLITKNISIKKLGEIPTHFSS